jgi:hypothetical protein
LPMISWQLRPLQPINFYIMIYYTYMYTHQSKKKLCFLFFCFGQNFGFLVVLIFIRFIYSPPKTTTFPSRDFFFLPNIFNMSNIYTIFWKIVFTLIDLYFVKLIIEWLLISFLWHFPRIKGGANWTVPDETF